MTKYRFVLYFYHCHIWFTICNIFQLAFFTHNYIFKVCSFCLKQIRFIHFKCYNILQLQICHNLSIPPTDDHLSFQYISTIKNAIHISDCVSLCTCDNFSTLSMYKWHCWFPGYEYLHLLLPALKSFCFPTRSPTLAIIHLKHFSASLTYEMASHGFDLNFLDFQSCNLFTWWLF